MFIYKIKNLIRKTSLYRLYLSRNKPIILTDVYGIRFVLYPWDTMPIDKHLSRRNYVSEFTAMERIIKKGGTIFDVGANIGLHSVLFSRWVGQNGKVFSFEPVPDTRDLLLETLALNKAFDVAVIDEALSDKVGKMPIQIFPREHSVWNSLGHPVFEGIKPIKSVEIATNTLDNFCKTKNISKIDFLKIDVEGFEKFVFLGAREMLKNGSVKVLSFEISQIPLAGSNTGADEVFDTIKSFGYKVYAFNYSSKKFEGPITKSDAFYENYFASREDMTKI